MPQVWSGVRGLAHIKYSVDNSVLSGEWKDEGSLAWARVF